MHDSPLKEHLHAKNWDEAFIRKFLLMHNIRMKDSLPLEETPEKRISPKLESPSKDKQTKNESYREESSPEPTMTTTATDKLRKIWVCGPPRMNEGFDRAFDTLLPPYFDNEGQPIVYQDNALDENEESLTDLKPHQIDIL